MANKAVEGNLLLIGNWLEEDELRRLNQLVRDKITEWLEKDSKFINGKCNKSKLSYMERRMLMGHIYLLTLMHLGGQRRQFGALITKQVSSYKQISLFLGK